MIVLLSLRLPCKLHNSCERIFLLNDLMRYHSFCLLSLVIMVSLGLSHAIITTQVPACTVLGTAKCLSELPGCARAMPGYAPTGESSAIMTRERCAGLCYATGYTVAGVEFGSFCFCSNSTPTTPAATTCNMTCAGNSSQICGGNCVLDVFNFACEGPRPHDTNSTPTTQSYYEAMFKRIDAA